MASIFCRDGIKREEAERLVKEVVALATSFADTFQP
jgi:hypothetical protein